MPHTDIQALIGKNLTMWVTETMTMRAKVLSESKVEYQFHDEDAGADETVYTTDIHIKHDDIDHVDDYCIEIGGMSRYFLHQFDIVE